MERFSDPVMEAGKEKKMDGWQPLCIHIGLITLQFSTKRNTQITNQHQHNFSFIFGVARR
ncbi:hypothetical protein [Melghirimyces algeriensis]|uniref:hypothetical protein n=1 Tax=Melghirimyces algeriensis TaxID=910412 RepID=UPI00163D6FC3|nr:hypothetical protein [Melghirimyces algeriensis]